MIKIDVVCGYLCDTTITDFVHDHARFRPDKMFGVLVQVSRRTKCTLDSLKSSKYKNSPLISFTSAYP